MAGYLHQLTQKKPRGKEDRSERVKMKKRAEMKMKREINIKGAEEKEEVRENEMDNYGRRNSVFSTHTNHLHIVACNVHPIVLRLEEHPFQSYHDRLAERFSTP